MRKSILHLGLAFLCICFSVFSVAETFDKKELKQLKKNYNEYEKGKIFKKQNRVAILGGNLRFRTSMKQAEQTSRKKKYAKFAAISTLSGIDDKVFQSITDEYNKMLKERFEAMELEIVPYEEIAGSKSYDKLLTKSVKETTNNRKNWGISRIFTADDQPFIVFNSAKPFGPHRKLPKELDAILYNSVISINFAKIGIDITQTGESYSTFQTIYIPKVKHQ